MALETVSNIQDLVITNPVGATDPKSEGDDHIRNIKKALKADLPNITGPITATQAEINLLAGIGGAVVSTTDTQTLTNKTLTVPAITLKQGTTPTVEGDIQWDATNNTFKVGDGSGTKTFSDDSVFFSGATRQVINTQTGVVATGSTLIPYDDTIPQNTEGDEYMTLAITPKSATNKLIIDVEVNVSDSFSVTLMAALFQDTTSNALASEVNISSITTTMVKVSFRHYMTAGTTSATTFKVRVGSDSASGQTTFNGASGARKFGGVLPSSITITEIQA